MGLGLCRRIKTSADTKGPHKIGSEGRAMSEEEVPRDLQLVGLLVAVLITATLVSKGSDLDGGLKVFLASLPTCALGLVIYKLWVRHEFRRPKAWPEWILLYLIGTIIGRMVVVPIRLLLSA